jgi:hypothetical protein
MSSDKIAYLHELGFADPVKMITSFPEIARLARDNVRRKIADPRSRLLRPSEDDHFSTPDLRAAIKNIRCRIADLRTLPTRGYTRPPLERAISRRPRKRGRYRIRQRQLWLCLILRRGDDGADLRPCSWLGSLDCIDERARFFDQRMEHLVGLAVVKAHDYPAAEEKPVSRVAQDHRI